MKQSTVASGAALSLRTGWVASQEPILPSRGGVRGRALEGTKDRLCGKGFHLSHDERKKRRSRRKISSRRTVEENSRPERAPSPGSGHKKCEGIVRLVCERQGS